MIPCILPLNTVDSLSLPHPPVGRHVISQREHPVPANVRRRGKAPPVEPFTGEKQDELLDDWLPTLKRAGVWNAWSNEELLMQLAGHLRGRALQEWNLLTPEEKSGWKNAVTALKSRLEPRDRAVAAQDFRHAIQKTSETVADYIRRIERAFQLAYGRDNILRDTREMILLTQLKEGLLYQLVESPAVSGARSYSELCLTAKNEEKRQAELSRRQYYQQTVGNRKLGLYTPTPQQVKSEPPQLNLPPDRGGQSPTVKEPRRCYNCDSVGHLARDCKVKTESSGQQHRSRNRQVRFKEQEQSEQVQPSPTSYLLSDSDSAEEDTVKAVRVKHAGSGSRCVKVDVQGVPVYGLIDTGSDITIIGGTMFKKVAAAARLRKKNFKSVDKVAYTYDKRPFRLDGRMNLEITFNNKSIITQVYLKMDAPEQLLLSEGVCRQLGMLSYISPQCTSMAWRSQESEYPPGKGSSAYCAY